MREGCVCDFRPQTVVWKRGRTHNVPSTVLCYAFNFFSISSHNYVDGAIFYPHFAEGETGGQIKDLPEVVQQVGRVEV